MPFHVLFLCTGNYYRSRFAEILFNTMAADEGLDLRASSRGVALDRGVNNIGPISTHTLKELRHRKIKDSSVSRFPLQVREEDLRTADLVIALDEEEHRSLIRDRFPEWVDRIEYWNIADLWATVPDEALAAIECKVRELVGRLRMIRPSRLREPGTLPRQQLPQP